MTKLYFIPVYMTDYQYKKLISASCPVGGLHHLCTHLLFVGSQNTKLIKVF